MCIGDGFVVEGRFGVDSESWVLRLRVGMWFCPLWRYVWCLLKKK